MGSKLRASVRLTIPFASAGTCSGFTEGRTGPTKSYNAKVNRVN